jgi:ribosomal protein S18 acetylase RimI-like enzyme
MPVIILFQFTKVLIMIQQSDIFEVCIDAHEISNFIESTSNYLLPATFEKVTINDYSKKIVTHGIALVSRDIGNCQINGILTFYMNDNKTFTAYISLVVVKNEFRNRKIASSLMEKCIEMCFHANMNKIIVETWSNNSVAVNFYKKYGFINSEEYINETGICKLILIRTF